MSKSREVDFVNDMPLCAHLPEPARARHVQAGCGFRGTVARDLGTRSFVELCRIGDHRKWITQVPAALLNIKKRCTWVGHLQEQRE